MNNFATAFFQYTLVLLNLMLGLFVGQHSIVNYIGAGICFLAGTGFLYLALSCMVEKEGLSFTVVRALKNL